jgi:pantetheine-phosphate adenylyltransferase
MEKIAVFAGSFCPFTKGHEEIVSKALLVFDKIIIAIGYNIQKQNLFTVEQRMQWIRDIYKDHPAVEVTSYTGLTVELCRATGARFLIRGLRNTADFIAEQEMAAANHQLCPEVETVFLASSPELSAVSSSLVRELWSFGADYTPYLSYKLPDIQQQ